MKRMTLVNIDLNALSLKELKDLQGQVAKAITSFEDRRKKEAIAELEEKAKEMGEDTRDETKKEVQELTKKYEDAVGVLAKSRESEVMEDA